MLGLNSRSSLPKRFAMGLGALVLWGLSLATAQQPTVTYSDLHDFNSSAGDPYGFQSARLAQARDGNLYVESRSGGTESLGTVASLSTSTGTPKIISSFTGTDGDLATGGLTLGTDGLLYGDAQGGGPSNDGVTFKITTTGTLTTLHNFTNTGDGYGPVNALVLATDGNYYGLTNSQPETFYKVTPAGVLTTLATFTNAEGYQGGQLFQGSDGNLYGGLNQGGTNSAGTLFKVSTAGVVTVLHNFAVGGSDGAQAATGMVQAPNGTYYGTPSAGGTNGVGVVYKLTSTGTYTVLHDFGASTDGANPGVLMLANDGNMYGVTNSGGSNNCGTLFKVTQAGAFSVLYNFVNSSGCNPGAYLTQDTDGNLYGVTNAGGANGDGSFFKVNLGLSAFITLQQTAGNVGSKIGILGQGFSSSSVVKFNGVQATTVTLTGTTYLTATVPTGASSGYVTVTTGSTTLTSTQKFTVHNSWSSGAAMPTALNWSSAGVIGSKAYVVGGYTGGPASTDNQIFNLANNTWTTGAALPTATAQATAAVVSGTLYLFGGSNNGGGTVFNTVWAYNPTTNAWSSKAAMPTARCSAAAVVSGGIVYVIGGYSGGSRLSTVEAYNPATDSWTEEASLLNGKTEIAAGLVSGKIVAADGFTSGGDTGDNESYDIATNTWSALTPDPTARNGTCSGVINNLLYVSDGNNNSNGPISLMESFSLSKDSWTTLLAMPNTVTDMSSAVYGGQLYCFGGGNNAVPPNNTVYDYVQIYQP